MYSNHCQNSGRNIATAKHHTFIFNLSRYRIQTAMPLYTSCKKSQCFSHNWLKRVTISTSKPSCKLIFVTCILKSARGAFFALRIFHMSPFGVITDHLPEIAFVASCHHYPLSSWLGLHSPLWQNWTYAPAPAALAYLPLAGYLPTG